MGILEVIILGLVQGLTEFIPVSSSGHLVLVPWLLGWAEPSLIFDTTLHLGTVVALLAYFWRDFWGIATAWLGGWRSFTWKDPAARLGWYLIVGTVPAVVLGVLFSKQFEALFGEPGFVGGALVVTGCVLALSERLGRRYLPLEQVGLGAALLVGVAQAIAIMPGISRSGATISTGLGTGLTRPAAARFSFLLGTPIIAGAGIQQLINLGREGGSA
ncbi:MAG: undecaprenyl-diphosphate phosphatase, partial [Chloroflexota bacterium]